ncbi:MAG: tRNA (N(6)-L-threonylcarbamoyladenosine(37)-C(2))-methylthiotransferase MtaB [Chloroflexi bacterium]|nr:tRNA (N(6)-L-threonylcarbamoyladenosine(37)-C(2))-methylthiotransferase MtaB [Chloroflexota bacterium]
MKVALDTLGCKLNQAETESLARQLAEAGHHLVSPLDEADVYLLNTCTVTHLADAKSRHWLRLAHRRNPEALVVATGCYAQRVPQELAQIDGVSLVVSNEEKSSLLRIISELGGPDSSPNNDGSFINSYPASRTRAFIKIQDSCNRFCSYCIVPFVRGREKSLPAEQIVAEVKQRVADGAKEMILTGTDIGLYHNGGINLAGLVENILAKTDVTRLRLSSLQPQEISAGLIGLWRDRRLCPHFHLSLQSGSNRVLQRMKRGYSVKEYQGAVSLIRAMVPDVAITTDIIVGFPGETDEEFEESYNFCRQMAFARIHVFSYSLRNGTQAAQLPHQISSPVKKQRSQKMLALHKESTHNFNQRFLGKTLPVLWEKPSAGVWSGLTGNYIKVYTRSDENLTNKLLQVKLDKFWRDGMWGEKSERGNKGSLG